jgi:hypothetical protein
MTNYHQATVLSVSFLVDSDDNCVKRHANGFLDKSLESRKLYPVLFFFERPNWGPLDCEQKVATGDA